MNDLVATRPRKLPTPEFTIEPIAYTVTMQAFYALIDVRLSDPDLLRQAEAALASFITHGTDTLDKARAWLSRAQEPATRQEIAVYLAMIVGAFPNAQKADLATYGSLLAMDVAALKPTRFALERAAAGFRRKAKFLPVISEVLEAVENELAHGKRINHLFDRACISLIDPEKRLSLIRDRLAEIK